ncbi:MAG: hypothetical protein M3356_00235, partial [Actinomycetota bacterium]|nr:hypothetical protein [Actinomycetota bacterium]
MALAGGCGGEDEPAGGAKAVTGAKAAAGAEAKPVGPERAGSVTQYADCDDWRAGSPGERRATVVELRSQLTPQTSETAESPLADGRAYEILQKACKPDYAGSLRLYKLYVRAQGFAPLSD